MSFYCVLCLMKTIYYKSHTLGDHWIILCLLIFIGPLWKELWIVHVAVIQPIAKYSYLWVKENSCWTLAPKLTEAGNKILNYLTEIINESVLVVWVRVCSAFIATKQFHFFGIHFQFFSVLHYNSNVIV